MGLQKESSQKEKKGWIFSMISSKLIIIVVLLLAGAVWYGFYATHTKEISGSDDREYTSIARNIVKGKGIVRNVIYPVDINFFEKLPVPEFLHPPGYPMIIAGFFRLFGVSDFGALLPSYLSYFIVLILLFFFTKKYVGIKEAAMVSVIFIFNKEILDTSLVALSEAVYTLSFFLFLILLIKAKSLRGILIAGILLGVSHLIRENIYPFLIPLLVYLYFYPELPRRKKMIFFMIGILIPIIPNMIRSFLETGSPFFSYGKFALMAFTDKYPWLNIYRDIQNPSLFEFLINEPGQFISKYLSNLVNALGQIMSVSNPYLLSFFIVEMFYWKISPQWKRIKMLFLFLLIFQILFVSLFTLDQRFFIPFIPMMIVFASQSFLRISVEWVSEVKTHWKKRIYLVHLFLFFIFFVVPSTYLIIRPSGTPSVRFKTLQFGFIMQREEAKRLNNFLKKELKDSQVVWTVLPEILEWEGNRLCGWLPTKIEKIYEINKKFPVDAILLTNLRAPHRMEYEWKDLLSSDEGFPQYRTVKFYEGRTIFAKLLIRDEKE